MQSLNSANPMLLNLISSEKKEVFLLLENFLK